MPETIIKLENLKKHYPVHGGVFRRQVNSVKALDGINLDIRRGECLGLVGESGCGKTTTGKAIIRLHDPTSGKIIYYPAGDNENGDNEIEKEKSRTEGSGIDISKAKPASLKKMGIRAKLQMVFQDPTTSLNPRMLIKNIIAEPIREQTRFSSRELEERIIELLNRVGLSKDHLLRYPHEFSGGQRQRIAVARAIGTNPEFLILDEPTSALDVSVQAQILNLLKKLQAQLNLTYLFVTHHLLVVKYVSDRLAVMYLGKIVEIAPTKDLFNRPRHPYTHALLSGIPVPDVDRISKRMVLTGDVPSPLNPPEGCRFHTRCPFAISCCREIEPELENVDSKGLHKAACHRKKESQGLVEKMFG